MRTLPENPIRILIIVHFALFPEPHRCDFELLMFQTSVPILGCIIMV